MQLAGAQATEALGAALGKVMRVGDVIALEGELGAGKTTLARGVARGLGFAGDVVSPTFPIVQIYDGSELRLPLWHVDLYRIDDPAELAELGLDDARGDSVLVIEWAERLGTALWSDSLRLRLQPLAADARALTAFVPPAWEGRWPPP